MTMMCDSTSTACSSATAVSDVSHHSSASSSSISPMADSHLVEDQLLAILLAEDTYQVPHVPCTAPPNAIDGRVPYGEWRRKICQWSFKVIDHFRLDREVVSSAMNIFDRYLACVPKAFDRRACCCPSCQRSVDSRTFQLAAMTSLYIAMKMSSESSTEERPGGPRKLRLLSFVELSRGQFCADDIKNMERIILSELRWKVHPPTPMTLVSYLLRLMPSHDAVPIRSRPSYDLVLHVLHELARYLTELSVCLGNECSIHSSSQIAYAAILVSMDLLTDAALPFVVRDAFNEVVVCLSSSSGGTILTPHDEPIRYLQDRLRRSFWPEMLMDDCENAEAGHPISMARDYGLLDIASITAPLGPMVPTPTAATTSPYGYAPNNAAPYQQKWFGPGYHEVSPVSVTRAAI